MNYAVSSWQLSVDVAAIFGGMEWIRLAMNATGTDRGV